MPDIADPAFPAYRLYCQLCDALKIAGPASYPNDFSKIMPRDGEADQKIIGIIKKAFAAQAVLTIDEVNKDIVLVQRKANANADRWQEVSICDKITDALALKTKALRKEHVL